jgi:hypothetical protein
MEEISPRKDRSLMESLLPPEEHLSTEDKFRPKDLSEPLEHHVESQTCAEDQSIMADTDLSMEVQSTEERLANLEKAYISLAAKYAEFFESDEEDEEYFEVISPKKSTVIMS